MPRQVEFLFDVGSPTAYLAWTQMPKLAESIDAEIVYVPVLLGGILKASGNSLPAECRAKVDYTMTDCARFAARFRVPFQPNPHFPVNTLMAMRAVTGAQSEGLLDVMLTAAFRAMWVEGVKLDEATALESLADAVGIRVSKLAHWIGDETIKAHLRANTDRAVHRGAFGAPTFFVGEEMFFGQDRLDWVAEAAKQAA